MTAQIDDHLTYQERDFCITAVNGKGLYDPREHGIDPRMITMACGLGYICGYVVQKGQLLLGRLHLGFLRNNPPKREELPLLDDAKRSLFAHIFKRSPIPEYRWHISRGPEIFGKQPKICDDLFGKYPKNHPAPYCYVYDGLDAPISFTGNLLLGDGFIRELYKHGGSQSPYKYRKVLELTFQDGLLLAEQDRSAEAEVFRNRRSKCPPKSPDFEECRNLSMKEVYEKFMFKEYEGTFLEEYYRPK